MQLWWANAVGSNNWIREWILFSKHQGCVRSSKKYLSDKAPEPSVFSEIARNLIPIFYNFYTDWTINIFVRFLC